MIIIKHFVIIIIYYYSVSEVFPEKYETYNFFGLLGIQMKWM